MKFDDYQKFTKTTAMYPKTHTFPYLTIGLAGEAGEVAEKVKKVIRDKGGKMDQETRNLLALELGDVLWYLARFADELKFKMSDIAHLNKQKLLSRKKRGRIKGSGDLR